MLGGQKSDLGIRFQAICCSVFESIISFFITQWSEDNVEKDVLELTLAVWLSLLSRQVVQTLSLSTDLRGEDD